MHPSQGPEDGGLCIPNKYFNFCLRGSRKPLTVHIEQVYKFRSLQLSYLFPLGKNS